MNITDVQLEKLEGDKLDLIFAKQTKLEEKYNQIEKDKGALVPSLPLDLDTFKGQERMRLLIYRITEELYEAGNCMRNKAWKQSEVPIDRDHFLEEMADALHFYVQAFIEMGLSSEDLLKLYFKKAKVNTFRQETKY